MNATRFFPASVVLFLALATSPALAATGVQFDGTNDYITFGQAPDLGSATFTLELWFRRDGTGASVSTGTGGVTAIPLLTKGRGEADGDVRDMNYFLGIRASDNVLTADFEEGTGTTSPGLNHPVAGSTPIQIGLWYHAAATFDGTTWRLYLNGLQEAELVVGANRLPQANSTQHAGLATAMQSNGSAAGYFQGMIDEARVWSRARSQAAIADSMTLEITSGDGLLGRWGMNEGTGTTAANSVPSGSDGTLTNGPTWQEGSPFEIRNALAFGSGQAYVTFGTAPSLGLATFTLETWFKRDGTGTTVSTGTGGVVALPLITKGRGEADGDTRDMNYFLGIRTTDNVLVADFEEGAGGSSPGLNHPVEGTTPITTGIWYHAAATYDGATWRLYLNGTLDGEQAVGEPPQSSSIQHAALGTALNSSGSASGSFNGTLDEVRVWNVARTGPEIAATINDEIAAPTAGLVARWGLDEGAGATASDAVGSTDGTITGSGWAWAPSAPFDLYVGPPVPPEPPSDLTATALSSSAIQLGWTDNAVNETAFEVERSENGSGGPYALLATLGANITSHLDEGLDPTTEYCYRVRATNGEGPSAYSGFACDTTPAEVNHSIDFGGTDGYVTFGDPSELDLATFTLELWFRRDGAGSTANTGSGGVLAVPLVTKGVGEVDGDNRDMNFFLGIRGSDGVLAADFEEGAGGASPGLNHPVTGSTPVLDGAWYHAAATYDGTTWKLYLNGILDGETTVGQPPQSGSIQHAAIASALTSTGSPSGYWEGAIDEVRIWDHARTQAEIQADLNTPISAPQSGLVARWSLNEGAGTLVNGSAGTAVGGSVLGSNWTWAAGAPFDIVINAPPDAPTGETPPDMATDVGLDPMMTVAVDDADGDTLTVAFYGRAVSAATGPDFSLVMLPDTQYYTAEANGGSASMLGDQARWVVANRAARNIAMVTQVGDCAEHGDNGGDPIEWIRADSTLGLLENPATTGLPEGIPFQVTVGNHDQSPNGDATGTTTFFNQYFGESRFAGRSYYGGHYGTNNDNHFALFSAGGLDFILLSFEYDSSPDAPVLDWADSLLAAYSGRRAIVSTHSLIGTGNPGSFSSQGSAIYNALRDRPNLFLMLCGHVPGEGRRVDTYNGSTVYTVLADYQSRTNGGSGWLRVLDFSPSAGQITVRTYSPTLDQWETDSDSEFTLDYAMAPTEEWQLIGTVNDVLPGGTASVSWPGRAPSSEYEWYVTVDDGLSTTTGPVWSFTTGIDDTELPVVEILNPDGGEAVAIGSATDLEWAATDNVGVVSVDVYLSRTGRSGPYEALATGLPNSGAYTWTVTGPATGTAFWSVVAHDGAGNAAADTCTASFFIQGSTTGTSEVLPARLALGPMSPNPVRGSGRIRLALPVESPVRLAVLDVRGREVAVLREETLPAGFHDLAWNGEGNGVPLPAGVYFLRVTAAGKALVQKVVLLR